MNLKNLVYHQMKPPCSRCPYKLGLVRTLINPCPQCGAKGYEAFRRFQRQLPGGRPAAPDARR